MKMWPSGSSVRSAGTTSGVWTMGWMGAGIRRKVQTLKWMKDLASAAIDPDRPLLAQIVVSRRCNLSCGYCY